jgi:hypothetical protein
MFRAWPDGTCSPFVRVVGLGRLELPTSRLSGVRSNHLSYRPSGSFKTEQGTSRNLEPGTYGTTEAVPHVLLRKEVIQPQVPLRLPCYDFTPITDHTLGAYLP